MKLANGNNSSPATAFDAVSQQEHAVIAARRLPTVMPEEIGKTAALAFSGGGIRSAVFNLGFIQGLANRGAMPVFDYLSTVSGGGYIGGWLSALHHRRAGEQPAGEVAMRELQKELLPPTGKLTPESGDAPAFPPPESAPIRYLRRYSNYLTPRLGLSGDTLALISLMARNMAVMQLLLVSLLVAAFAFLLAWMGFGTQALREPPNIALLSAGITVLFLWALANSLLLQKRWRTATGEKEGNPSVEVTIKVLLPSLFSGVLTALMFSVSWKYTWGGAGAIGVGLVYLFGWMVLRFPPNHKSWVGAIGGAVTLGGLFHLVFTLFPVAHPLTWAPLVAMLVFSLTMTVHLALAGDALSEGVREWWARLGGQGMFLALAWTTVFLFLLYVPPLLQYGLEKALHWLIAGGGLWSLVTVVGTRLANGKHSGGAGSALALEIAVKIVPWVFLAGLLALVAWGFIALLIDFGPMNGDLAAAIADYQGQLGELSVTLPFAIFLGAGAVFFVLMRHVDLNLFSAHSFYVNRLARTFLGASRAKRSPERYTGFDPADDLKLSDLAGQRPIHLINANLNLTGGEDLAWQTRRGACFTFAPAWSGYTARNAKNEQFGGYRPSTEYAGGLTLATAVAVSGAAASPNMGFHTSTSVAALLTAFNLRLARWCPNPMWGAWQQTAPRTATKPFFAELFGDTTGRNAWINLSDGGHFENLGLYELIRRRVGLILVTDAAADGGYRFDDLAMAVRKIAVDFGVTVDIPEQALNAIRPPKDSPFSKRHWAYGKIGYPDGEAGYLIYVKASIGAEAPIDIRQYRDANPAFPHESTADQWFDEDQFESYRHLGQTIAETLLEELNVPIGERPAADIIEDLYRLAAAAYAKGKAQQAPATTHQEEPRP